jgi:zinc transport system substrate-binding protein
VRTAAAALALILLLAACGASTTAPAPGSPLLHVVTGLYPLAQAAKAIGQDRVDVVDVVPAGADPMTYRLTGPQIEQVREAGLVLDAGRGFQPSFEKAAAGAQHVLAVATALGVSDPYVWIDPATMVRAVSRIAAAMEAADPRAAGAFRRGEAGFRAEVQSTAIDYESTLSACPRTEIFTPDGAFSAMAHNFGLQDYFLGVGAHPSSAAVRAGAASVDSAGASTLFSEPWVPAGSVVAVARATHTKVATLDTLAGPPAGGWPANADYINLLEANLGTISSALGCPNGETGND